MSAKKSDYGDTSNGSLYYSNTTDSGCLTTQSGSIDLGCTTAYTIDPKRMGIITNITEPENKSKGDENMRYLYEVILVNPKNDTYYATTAVARSETSALMKVYEDSQFKDKVDFDDLKTSCRVLMEWKKEKSLKKAIETIKEAVE